MKRSWESEITEYQEVVRRVLEAALPDLDLPFHMPPMPLDNIPGPFANWCYRAFIFYRIGAVIRVREAAESIRLLLSEGYISATAPLIRLAFEIHAVTHYLTDTLKRLSELILLPKCNESEEEITRCLKRIDRVFEGVRSPVSMPRGEDASERPIHIMDAIRSFSSRETQNDYDFLCEGSHPNLPQYFQWHLAGKLSNNWSNDVARKTCHLLLKRSFDILEESSRRIRDDVRDGLRFCDSIIEATYG